MTHRPALLSHVAVYCRISSDREGLELGVDRQREDCLALCARNGWTVAEVYVDNDVSASTRTRKRRPEFERLLAAAERGEVDGIVFYTTSRLTRRPLEYERLITLVETRGTALASVRSGTTDLTTADGRMVARILAAADAAEAERTGERVARAHEQRRARGEHHGAGVQFGYRQPGMVVEPAEAAAICQAADIILRGGTIGDVIKAWDAAGVRPRRAAHWSWNAVRCSLLRPSLAGLVALRGQVVGEGTWTPILPRPTWEAVCERLARRERRPGSGTRTHLLSGFLTCGVCGHHLSSRGTFYCCAPERGGCGRLKRNEAWLVDAVTDLVGAWLDCHDTGGEVAGAETEVATLAAEVAAAEAKIRGLREQFEAGAVDGEDFYPMLRTLRGKVNDLKARQVLAVQAAVVVQSSDARAVLRAGTLAERRQVLAQVVETVVVKPVGKIGRRPLTYDCLDVLWR